MFNEGNIYTPGSGSLLQFKNFLLSPGHDQSIGHIHEVLEFAVVKSGEGIYYIDDRTYDVKPRDVFVINNIERHGLKLTHPQGMVYMAVHFDPRFIWNANGNLFDYRYLKIFFDRDANFEHRMERHNPITENVIRLIYEIEQEFESAEPENELMVKVKLMNILVLFARYYASKSTYLESETEKTKMGSYTKTKRLSGVMEYIDSNFTEELKLEQLAELANMSPSYFSFFFKKLNGISVSKYITQKRVQRAREYLVSTNKTILEIASLCGFNNTSNFYKAFKGVTGRVPSEFKDRIV